MAQSTPQNQFFTANESGTNTEESCDKKHKKVVKKFVFRMHDLRR